MFLFQVSSHIFTSTSLQSKTNYSMRVAALSSYGTRGFSTFSPNFETNCKSYAIHVFHLQFVFIINLRMYFFTVTCNAELMSNETSKIQVFSDFCSVTNLRVRVATDIYENTITHKPRQRMKSWIYWEVNSQGNYSDSIQTVKKIFFDNGPLS